jgi:hypothetical protein
MEESNKCYDCGKCFKTRGNLKKHKNRKTPCLIRNVDEKDKSNPNRCIFCNKILKNKRNLKRHYVTCRIKNGGIDILYEKIKYEEIKRENDKLKQEKEELEEKYKRLEEKYNEEVKEKNIINIHNGDVINNNITINFNSYDKPEFPPPLRIENVRTLGRYPTISKFLLDYIWFNKQFPQNHTILPANVKRKETIVYDGSNWSRKDNDEVLEKVNRIVCYGPADNAILDGQGEEFIFGGGWDEYEEKVPELIAQRMKNHIELKDELENKDIYGKMLSPFVLKKLKKLKKEISDEPATI